MTRIQAREQSLNRFVFGRARPANLDKTFVKPIWPNHGYAFTSYKNRGFGDLNATKSQVKSINKTVIVGKARRAVSNARPDHCIPMDMRLKIEENRKALRERVELINYMQK